MDVTGYTSIVYLLHGGHWKASQIKRTRRYLWYYKLGNGSTCQAIHYFLQFLIGHVFSLEGHADGIARTTRQILQRNSGYLEHWMKERIQADALRFFFGAGWKNAQSKKCWTGPDVNKKRVGGLMWSLLKGLGGICSKGPVWNFLNAKKMPSDAFLWPIKKINCFSAIFIVVWGADSAGLSMSLCFTFSQ